MSIVLSKDKLSHGVKHSCEFDVEYDMVNCRFKSTKEKFKGTKFEHLTLLDFSPELFEILLNKKTRDSFIGILQELQKEMKLQGEPF